MNKVFKSIWNAATGSWVAVSELGKSQGKKNSKTVLALSTAALVGALSMNSAWADAFDSNGTAAGFGTETTANWDTTTANWNVFYNGNSPTSVWQQGGNADFYARAGSLTLNVAPGISAYAIEVYGGTGNVLLQGSDLSLMPGAVLYVGTGSLEIKNNISAIDGLSVYNSSAYQAMVLSGKNTIMGSMIANGGFKLTGGSVLENLYLQGNTIETGADTVKIKNIITSGTIALGGDVEITQDNNTDLYLSTTGTGRLVKTGGNVVSVGDVNTLNHTGGTVIGGVDGLGGLRVSGERSDTPGKVLNNVALAGGNYVFNTTNTTIVSGDTITGEGRIFKEGGGNLTLNGSINTTNSLDGDVGRNFTSSDGGNTTIASAQFANSGKNASSVLLATPDKGSSTNQLLFVNVSTTGDNSHGVELYNGVGSTTEHAIEGSTIKTEGVGSAGVLLNQRGESSNTNRIRNTTIDTYGQSSSGVALYASEANTLTTTAMNGNTITTHGDNSSAINASNTGAADTALAVNSANSTYSSTGKNSSAIVSSGAYVVSYNDKISGATNGMLLQNGSLIEVTNGTITAGEGAGIAIDSQATKVSSLTTQDTSVSTTGANSIGVKIGVNTKATLTNTDISTVGSSSRGLVIDNIGAVANPSSLIKVVGGSIKTTGNSSNAVVVQNASQVSLSGVAVETGSAIDPTLGFSSYGVLADATGNASLTGSSITTHGLGSLGAVAQNGGTMGVATSSITTDAMGAAGMGVTSFVANSTTKGILGDSKINTKGDLAHGAYVVSVDPTASTSLSISNSQISTAGKQAFGVVAIGASSVVQMFGNNSVSTLGAEAHDIMSTGGAQVYLQNGTMELKSEGADSVALRAENGGTIEVYNTAFTNKNTTGPLTAIASGGSIAFRNNSNGITNLIAENGGTMLVADGDLTQSTLTARTGSQATLEGNVATGSATRVFLSDNSNLNTVNASTPLNIGSVSGAGNIVIGAQTLSLGSANLDDTLTGDISAGNASLPPIILMKAGPLMAPLPPSVDGGIRKVGTGTLTLSGTGGSTYVGDTVVAEGTLRSTVANNLSPNSAHSVLSGASLDIGGVNQSLKSLSNAGTVNLVGAMPGTELTVKGAYVGQNGVLRLGTALGGSTSVADKLVLDGAGASASGKTTIQVVNQNGLGALTTGNGIEVVAARNGATTTAQTTKDAFSLAGGSVAAGAFEYHLRTGAGNESWYLSSATPVVVIPTDPTTPVEPGNPTAPTEPGATPQAPVVISVPTYRAEVPIIAALPAQIHQSNLVMLGSMRVRQGNASSSTVAQPSTPAPTAKLTGSNESLIVDLTAAAKPQERQAWGRAIAADIKLGQGGAVSPTSNGSVSGFQAGTDVWVSPAGDWKAGAYFGQLNGHTRVNGFSSGLANNYAGTTDLKSRFLGAYATYQQDGLYVDNVLQYSRHDNTISTLFGASARSKSSGILASVEVGKAFPVSENWSVEPQAQLIYEKNNFDDIQLGATRVKTDSKGVFTGRLGVQFKGDIATQHGLVQPYARVSLYKSSSGNTNNTYMNAAANTVIGTPGGSSFSEVAVGAVWQVQPTVAIYGEVSQLNRLGGSSSTRSATQGSMGVKVSW